ncbi:hypothetical protein K6U58_00030 [Vibrio fluvialis]|uniref:hypothetical protein n=1 Tax=Vibrio fluvialis TaxID=676 RepID=UPI001C9BF67D|nr:hypothetical protein [Vibrio fluvialis]MBY7960067.1 hypothetical protein [Vibrio fluvialis]MCG6356983.1 hypothetical protein [Vibrio fluvialis]
MDIFNLEYTIKDSVPDTQPEEEKQSGAALSRLRLSFFSLHSSNLLLSIRRRYHIAWSTENDRH